MVVRKIMSNFAVRTRARHCRGVSILTKKHVSNNLNNNAEKWKF